ncbi:MAG: hypothetical protein AAGF12_29345 [Myxococcota bacterium]
MRVAGTLMVLFGLILQTLAYRASPNSVTRPLYCVLWPWGSCEFVLGEGYRGLCQQAGIDAHPWALDAAPFAALGIALLGAFFLLYKAKLPF